MGTNAAQETTSAMGTATGRRLHVALSAGGHRADAPRAGRARVPGRRRPRARRGRGGERLRRLHRERTGGAGGGPPHRDHGGLPRTGDPSPGHAHRARGDAVRDRADVALPGHGGAPRPRPVGVLPSVLASARQRVAGRRVLRGFRPLRVAPAEAGRAPRPRAVEVLAPRRAGSAHAAARHARRRRSRVLRDGPRGPASRLLRAAVRLEPRPWARRAGRRAPVDRGPGERGVPRRVPAAGAAEVDVRVHGAGPCGVRPRAGRSGSCSPTEACTTTWGSEWASGYAARMRAEDAFRPRTRHAARPDPTAAPSACSS